MSSASLFRACNLSSLFIGFGKIFGIIFVRFLMLFLFGHSPRAFFDNSVFELHDFNNSENITFHYFLCFPIPVWASTFYGLLASILDPCWHLRGIKFYILLRSICEGFPNRFFNGFLGQAATTTLHRLGSLSLTFSIPLPRGCFRRSIGLLWCPFGSILVCKTLQFSSTKKKGYVQ